MAERCIEGVLKSKFAINIGPDAREMLRERAEFNYNSGCMARSIYFQVMMLLQVSKQRSSHKIYNGPVPAPDRLIKKMNTWERHNMRSNKLIQYALDTLSNTDDRGTTALPSPTVFDPDKFLPDTTTPIKGFKSIHTICQQMPKEWTIVQVTKGPRTDTTYTKYCDIIEDPAAIYVTILKHARSHAYPEPICLRIFDTSESKRSYIFRTFARMADIFQEIITVDHNMVEDKEYKKKYWAQMNFFEDYLAAAIKHFRAYFHPWLYLFSGSADISNAATYRYQEKVFASVDEFCNGRKWTSKQRVLLSLAAIQLDKLLPYDLYIICKTIAGNKLEGDAAFDILKNIARMSMANPYAGSPKFGVFMTSPIKKRNPCILVIDEILDHFYWEELNLGQEFCRISSLYCLWRLYKNYEQYICRGYLTLNIANGKSVINPDNNLPKAERRMKAFFNYWLPHWTVSCQEQPSAAHMTSDCFIYAGHGNGLQYMNGMQIAEQKIHAVVFLFGCDSTRLHSNGFYSQLLGSHLYYQSAMCPAVIGTILSGLDSKLDTLATAILSVWIPPSAKKDIPWLEVDRRQWSKYGTIKATDEYNAAKAKKTHTNVASLCEIIARVHQRHFEGKLFNTVGFVCRGLPVWNSGVQVLRS